MKLSGIPILIRIEKKKVDLDVKISNYKTLRFTGELKTNLYGSTENQCLQEYMHTYTHI